MNQPITQLRQRWLLTAILYVAAATFGYLSLRSSLQAHSIRWMGGTLFALTCHVGILWWGLPRNHRAVETELLPTLGFGNAITLTRGLAIGLLAGFLFAPRLVDSTLAWIPALLYTIAILLDYVDGYVARLTNHTTALGEMLDMEFDGLGILIAIAVTIQYGQIPPWYLLLGFGRPLFILGLWIRQRLGLPNYEMTESNNRRLIAGFQMGFLSIMLWPIFEPPVTTLACILFSIPLAGSFLRDWLVVSGQISPTSASYLRWHSIAKKLIESWLPLALRVIGFSAFAVLFYRVDFSMSAAWIALLKDTTPRIIILLLSAFIWLAPIAGFAFLLGVLGRTSALILAAVAALSSTTGRLGFAEVLLLVSALWVLQFGGGFWALWPVEERILGQRAGVK